MQLSNILSQNKQPVEITQHYLTCLIEQSHVTLALWGVVNDHPKIIRIGTPKEIPDETTIVDAVEIGLEEFRDAAPHLEGVLFSLPEDWIDGANIKSSYKSILKTISEKLVLQPVGYVLTSEALFQYLFQFKSASIKSLSFHWSSTEVTVYLTDHGLVEQTESVGRSESVPDDMTEALARFKQGQLPSQLYFFSYEQTSDQLEQDKQLFLAHNWDETQLFHHLPSIDIISRETLVEAACLSGGAEVLQPKAAETAQSDLLPVDMSDNEVPPDQNISAVEEHKEPDDKPILNVPPVNVDKKEKVFSFGVPIPSQLMKKPIQVDEDSEEAELAVDASVMSSSATSTIKSRFPKMKMPSFSGLIRRPSLPSGVKANKMRMGMVILGGMLLASIIGGYIFLASSASAQVDILLKTETVSTDVLVTLDPDIEETDSLNQVLKVDIENKEVSDSEESSTTGSKIIGEKAKGKVLILNKTTNLKTFSKGTEVKSGDKVFVLESDVTVASASTKESNDTQTTEFGKASASVIAKEIGADYNLDKEADFSVANFGKDTYSARSEDKFTGGSSREIQAVSNDDIAKLRASLKKALIEKAEQELTDSAGDGRYVVLTGKSLVKSEEFSAKLGDETHTLKLTMGVEVEGYVYESDDLKPIAKEKLTSLIPD